MSHLLAAAFYFFLFTFWPGCELCTPVVSNCSLHGEGWMPSLSLHGCQQHLDFSLNEPYCKHVSTGLFDPGARDSRNQYYHLTFIKHLLDTRCRAGCFIYSLHKAFSKCACLSSFISNNTGQKRITYPSSPARRGSPYCRLARGDLR